MRKPLATMLKTTTMKKLIFIFILNVTVLSTFGQQNPIQNLTFSQWYSMPNNCYTLSWSAPIPSITDTLVGYNIYRNESLYRFTTSTSQQCIPCLGDTNSAYCNSFFAFPPDYTFYIHVVAVYNVSLTESTYNDSAFFGPLATGVLESITNNDLIISPNPFSLSTTIRSGKIFRNGTMTIYDALGQRVKFIENISGQTFTLLRDNLSSGLYFMRMTEKNEFFTIEKLIITDK